LNQIGTGRAALTDEINIRNLLEITQIDSIFSRLRQDIYSGENNLGLSFVSIHIFDLQAKGLVGIGTFTRISQPKACNNLHN
jgi:hypothetical protein